MVKKQDLLVSKRKSKLGGKMGILNTKPEFYIESDATFHQLAKNSQAKEIAESTSMCYILKDKKFNEDVYKLSSKYLDESMPNYCEVEEIKKVVVECFYNGHWGCWKFSPILGKVAGKSGFSQVERWLDNWSKTKDDFEYNKKYSLWLLKVTYPASRNPSD
jgi:hypothetical protein